MSVEMQCSSSNKVKNETYLEAITIPPGTWMRINIWEEIRMIASCNSENNKGSIVIGDLKNGISLTKYESLEDHLGRKIDILDSPHIEIIGCQGIKISHEVKESTNEVVIYLDPTNGQIERVDPNISKQEPLDPPIIAA